MLLNFLVFQTSEGILSGHDAFLLLIFSNTSSSSSIVKYRSFVSWSFMIFWIGLSMISGGFLSRFLKCLSFWLAAFSFAPEIPSSRSLHLLSAMLFGIFYLKPSF